jgi:glutathione S-transferase
MKYPILYSFKRCPYAMRARMAIKLADIRCEIREVRLNNKPRHMLEISPKGTVPVLIFKDKIIDESIDIINWVINRIPIFKGNIEQNENELSDKLIYIFDNKFKYHLDRYKYSTRYANTDQEFHQRECYKILVDLENLISDKGWFFGHKLNKLDISILPFIRQFRIANPAWYDSQKDIPKVHKTLSNFLESELFEEAMHTYKVWEEGSNPVYFPIKKIIDQ